ncbi:MAG: hypothetical protein C4523_05095 [Myxococcales bacterium]|nr:MAG: hypothetical protein C4523_05095 [Myxococcales bacterium]
MVDTSRVFEPLPDEGDTQIHPYALFDGGRVWLAASLPDRGGSGRFDTVLTKLGCDGAALIAPFVVNTAPEVNNIDPVLAVNDSTLMVFWQGDNGLGPANMDIYVRRFDREGNALDANDWTLEPARQGQTVTGNLMMPAIAVDPASGGFVLAALWGIDAAPGFQAFLQRFDAEGNPLGDGIDGCLAPESSQASPTATVDASGVTHAAWSESDNAAPDDERVKRTWLGADSETPASPVTVCPQGVCGTPFLAAGAAEADGVYLAVSVLDGSQADIEVRPVASSAAQDEAVLTLGAGRGYDHTPIVAAEEGGGAAIWYRLVQGIRSEVWIQRFVREGQALRAAGDARRLNETAAPGYFQPTLVHIEKQVYLAVWAEGTSPAFRLKARFVDFEE